MKTLADARRSHLAHDAGRTMPARESRSSWAAANSARRKQARRKALSMLVLRINGSRGADTASLFHTSRAAVYQRLYRLRRRQYAGV